MIHLLIPDRIFAYLECISDFLTSNLPTSALTLLKPHLLPQMTTTLCTSTLEKYIPRTLSSHASFQHLISAAQNFEIHLQALDWTRENALQEWCSRSGEIWGGLRMEDVLDQTRGICKRGVLPTGRLVSSFGAVEYQTVNSAIRGSM